MWLWMIKQFDWWTFDFQFLYIPQFILQFISHFNYWWNFSLWHIFIYFLLSFIFYKNKYIFVLLQFPWRQQHFLEPVWDSWWLWWCSFCTWIANGVLVILLATFHVVMMRNSCQQKRYIRLVSRDFWIPIMFNILMLKNLFLCYFSLISYTCLQISTCFFFLFLL